MADSTHQSLDNNRPLAYYRKKPSPSNEKPRGQDLKKEEPPTKGGKNQKREHLNQKKINVLEQRRKTKQKLILLSLFIRHSIIHR